MFTNTIKFCLCAFPEKKEVASMTLFHVCVNKVPRANSNHCNSRLYLDFLTRLVVQRTKLVDESQEILLALLRQLTSGTEESAFMRTCVDALKKCPVNDIRTPVFIFEQLCNVIHKVMFSY